MRTDFSATDFRMEETLRTHLLSLGAAYTANKSVTLSAIGKAALNDNTVFARLRAGDMGFNVRTYDKLVIWFSANWPPDLEWPQDVERLLVDAHGDAAA